MKEMEQIKEDKAASSSSRSTYCTPPPRVAAPSPKGKGQAAEPKAPPKPPKGVEPVEIPPAPQTEGAKLARLRRLCEMKPSGKCSVPPEVHQRWKAGDKSEREAMVEEFEKANWAKDVNGIECSVVTLQEFTLHSTGIFMGR